jgi:molecular chaperone DnaK (HSP70)
VFLVGGSSRIPMVARLVHERLGIVPVTLDQPETVVARGALGVTAGAGPRSPSRWVWWALSR